MKIEITAKNEDPNLGTLSAPVSVIQQSFLHKSEWKVLDNNIKQSVCYKAFTKHYKNIRRVPLLTFFIPQR